MNASFRTKTFYNIVNFSLLSYLVVYVKENEKTLFRTLEVFPLFRDYTVSVRSLVRAKNVVVPHKSLYLPAVFCTKFVYIMCGLIVKTFFCSGTFFGEHS